MSSIPPIRPRSVFGYVERGGVRASGSFLRWLDAVREAINATTAVPTGTLRTSLSATEPSGWKVCNGQALDKTAYAELHAVIGDTFGGTTTTFNLPDMTNRVLVGAGTIALAEFGGASSVTLTEANLPSHTHAVADPGHSHAVTDPGHTHGVTDTGHTHGSGEPASSADAAAGSDVTSATSGTTGSATTGVAVDSATTGVTVDSQTTGLTIAATGGGEPFSIMPLGMGVAVLVKT